MTDPLIVRRDAAQKALDVWSARPLRFGVNDCVRMGASHLRNLGRRVKLPPSGSYRTANGAIKALKAHGYESVADALDKLGLERIAPAAAIVGDFVMLPAAFEQLGSLCIALGNGRVLGYHEELDCAGVLQPLEFVTAWRVDPI